MSEPPDENPWLIDFFEEGETHENVAPDEQDAPAGEHAARSPRRRGPSLEGRARAVRLAGLVLVVLVVATGIILAVSGGNASGSDNSYLSQISGPAADSQTVGTELAQMLGSNSSSLSSLESNLGHLLTRQRRDLNLTAAISPPPRLRTEQAEAVSAMQFRVGGIAGLLNGLKDASAQPTEANWPAELSLQADGLIASDVIWNDFFVIPTKAQVRSDGDTTASVPGSVFVANANFTAPSAMTTVLAQVEGHASTGSSGSQSSLLQVGDSGTAVKQWQEQLNEWIAKQAGLAKLKLTGSFDQATKTATMELQTAAGITADGVVGPMTRAALLTALGSGGSNGSSGASGTTTTPATTTTSSG
jgi:peptidoglycan hydrolase-like protein with peptidoglycan-binding domain